MKGGGKVILIIIYLIALFYIKNTIFTLKTVRSLPETHILKFIKVKFFLSLRPIYKKEVKKCIEKKSQKKNGNVVSYSRLKLYCLLISWRG